MGSVHIVSCGCAMAISYTHEHTHHTKQPSLSTCVQEDAPHLSPLRKHGRHARTAIIRILARQSLRTCHTRAHPIWDKSCLRFYIQVRRHPSYICSIHYFSGYRDPLNSMTLLFGNPLYIVRDKSALFISYKFPNVRGQYCLVVYWGS